MKITIKGQHIIEEPEPEMKLSFGKTKDGFVSVVGEDRSGSVWHIATFSDCGIYLEPDIPSRTGWPLDSNNRLVQQKHKPHKS